MTEPLLSHPGLEEAGQKERVLLFFLGGENYALPLSSVEAILPDCSAASVPRQPAFLEGFFETGGECIPLVNVDRLLGIVGHLPTQARKVLVLRIEKFRFAFRVDAILGTRESVEVDGQPFLLLDLEALLQRPETGARP